MSDYGLQLIKDLPDQFKNKPRIEALLRVVGRQLDEIAAFYDELNTMRTIELGEGIILDRIGDIVCMTRAEAAEILSLESKTVDDDTYRIVLKYKIMLNSSNCTYYDIMQSMDLIYGNNGMTYREEPTIPATIIIDIPEVSIDEEQTYVKLLKIKPAGVKIVWEEYFHIWMYVKSNVMLRNIHFFRMAFDFWNIRRFDGYHWNLDGEYLLDAHSRYAARVIVNTIMKIYLDENVFLRNVAFFWSQYVSEDLKCGFNTYFQTMDKFDIHCQVEHRYEFYTGDYEDMSRMTLTETVCYYFNGKFMLDGSIELGSPYTTREEF